MLMQRFARILLILITCLCTSLVTSATWSLPLPQEVTVKELIALAGWQKQFKITDGRDEGKVVPLILHRNPGNPERWTLTFGDYAAIRLTSDPTGALMMERLDLLRNQIFITYEPALPLLPQKIVSGVAIRRYVNFKMYDRDSGKLKRAGQAIHLVKQVSRSQFQTPAGLIEGYHVDLEHRMNIQYAQLHISLGLGCRLDEGPIYGSGRYTLKKLGLFSETKTAAATLITR
jgi:hypothetical protein